MKDSPYFRMDEAADFLRFTRPDGSPDCKACLHFLDSKKVPLITRGRRLLVRKDDVKSALGARRAS